MDLEEHLTTIAARIPSQTEHLHTEAATATTLVMPFIRALGYDVFDPTEVIPEFTADVGIKKGEKVDYAIKKDGALAILIEVKCWNRNLDEVHASQLYRYFSVTKARIGILTNGIVYRFFSDLDEPNKMDPKPFLEFSMEDLREGVFEELKRFTKSRFEVERVVSAASELKYTNGIKRALAAEYASPSDDFVRHLAKQVYSGNLTKAAREQFTDIVKRAFHQFLNDRINVRLQSALQREEEPGAAAAEEGDEEKLPEGVVAINGDIVTTEEEVEGFRIVQAIVAEVVSPERVVMRDTKSYCGVLFDDNNRKPICRLRFNTAQKYLGIVDREKNEDKVPIDSVRDIYTYAARLRDTAAGYLEQEAE